MCMENIGSSEPSCSIGGLKSSLKSSSRTNQSVSWADDQILCEFSGNNPKHKFRVASTEACAEEAVASGESDAPDVVSEAGIVILPPPADGDGAEAETELSRLKWTKKTGITESDFFDSFEDSLFDASLEEFIPDTLPTNKPSQAKPVVDYQTTDCVEVEENTVIWHI
ncbi:hypothetical protein Lser_V15G04484 [Lactuca serriola]